MVKNNTLMIVWIAGTIFLLLMFATYSSLPEPTQPTVQKISPQAQYFEIVEQLVQEKPGNKCGLPPRNHTSTDF